jgi:hypothetical protein
MDEWVRDMCRTVDDRLMKQIAEDFRRPPPPPGPTLPTVRPVDAAPVKTGSDVVAGNGTGWAESPQVNDWRAPGIDVIDRLVDQQDALDRAARIQELIEAGGQLKKIGGKE